MRPPEYPTDDLHRLGRALLGRVAFAWVAVGVLAVQIPGAAGALAELVNAQVALVQQGVGFAVDDAGHAAIDGQSGALGQLRLHVVAGHADTQGGGRLDAAAGQRLGRQRQAALRHCQ